MTNITTLLAAIEARSEAVVEVEYIESGTFQSSEEDVWNAEIHYGETCAVVKKELPKETLRLLAVVRALLEAVEDAPHGLYCNYPHDEPPADDAPYRCDCWKARTIADAEKLLGGDVK